jgi:hypothetical protein
VLLENITTDGMHPNAGGTRLARAMMHSFMEGVISDYSLTQQGLDPYPHHKPDPYHHQVREP